MAEAPNSSKALQQWQHLFEEKEEVELSRQDNIYNRCYVWDCRRVNMKTGKPRAGGLNPQPVYPAVCDYQRRTA